MRIAPISYNRNYFPKNFVSFGNKTTETKTTKPTSEPIAEKLISLM